MTLSLDAAISGMKLQQQNIETIAQNLANVNTTGYKRGKIHFQDILDASSVLAALTGTLGFEEASQSAGVGFGGFTRDFAQGALQPTGRELDFAISGDGFFQIRLEDGSMAYTRAGIFGLDGAGNLTIGGGQLMEPGVALPTQFRSLQMDDDGTISVMRDYTAAELAELDEFDPRDGVREVIGRLVLARFPNPEGLEPIGNSLYRETELSQAAIIGNPGDDGMGRVFSGWLEAANVDVAAEMTGLVMAKRGYQLNLIAYRTVEEMLSQANDLT